MGRVMLLIFVTSFVFVLYISDFDHVFCGQKGLIKEGDDFPEISMKTPSDPMLLVYLGLSEGKSFTLTDVKADLILVEIMNINCGSCRKQAPIYNKLYSLIESTPETKGRIKMLAIASGSKDEYIKKYIDYFKVPYPIIEDPNFALYEATGSSPLPLAIFVINNPSGQTGIVAGTHTGLNSHYKEILEEMKEFMNEDLVAIRQRGAKIETEIVEVEPVLTQAQLFQRIVKAFFMIGDGFTTIKKVPLEMGGAVYTSVGRQRNGSDIRLFALVVSRPPPCDLCHDIHFICIFENTGKILRFMPLQLTKYGNEPWDFTDEAKMRDTIEGKYIFDPFDFDPGVDAVTSATITCSIIYKSLNEGQALFNELKRRGLIETFSR
ncbi:MAG: TlpA disulfide reductase family protein [Thermodesulfobacteriota bacterium]|nr:TlpA disulfide reductase family protein [Thermodesulfobacteriota bacterium]